MNDLISFLDGISRHVNRICVALAGAVLVAMMLLASANVALRSAGFPVKGTFELMGFFGAIVASFSLGKTYISGEHIAVDIFLRRFSLPLRKVLTAANDIISMAFFCIAAWQVFRWGMQLHRVHELSETLRIHFYPFVYGVSLGCGVIAFVLAIEAIRSVSNRREA